MGKLLRLKNGAEYTTTISSTITGLSVPVANYAAVDTIKHEMTQANLETVVFDGVTYTDLQLIGDQARRTGSGIVAEFSMELGIEDRIEQERQDAIDAYTLQLIEEGLL